MRQLQCQVQQQQPHLCYCIAGVRGNVTVEAPARIPKWAWRSGVHPVELAKRIGERLEGGRGAPLPYDASLMANALAGGEPDLWLLIERMQPGLKGKRNSDEG